MELIIKNPFPFWERETNEIDKLIENLSRPCWKPNLSASTGLWHKYDLPYIGISDEDRISEQFYFDGLLGTYNAVDDDNWEKEGRIVLFKKSIERVAETYSTESSIPKHGCFINITKIVLLHEIGHWIFHYMPTEESSHNKFYNNNIINDDLREAIAQKITKIAIDNNNELKKVFHWLCKNQPKIYQNELEGNLTDISVLRNSIDKSYNSAEVVHWASRFEVNEKNPDQKSKDLKPIIPENSLTKGFPKTFNEYNDSFLDKNRGEIAGKKFGL